MLAKATLRTLWSSYSTKALMPGQVFLRVWLVTLAGLIETQKTVLHSRDDECSVAGRPALQPRTRQLRTRYPLAIQPYPRGHILPGGFVRHGSPRSAPINLCPLAVAVVIFVQLLVSIAQVDRLERKQFCFCPFVLALGYEQLGPQVHY